MKRRLRQFRDVITYVVLGGIVCAAILVAYWEPIFS